MHTITSLRKALDLSTTNQVRNRIDAVKDVLAAHLRRGPNNQILLTDEGLQILRRLQELYDSGLTMAEASEVLRATTNKDGYTREAVSSRTMLNQTIPSQTGDLVRALRDEIAFLRERVTFLEAQLRAQRHKMGETAESPRWWERLRGEIDAS